MSSTGGILESVSSRTRWMVAVVVLMTAFAGPADAGAIEQVQPGSLRTEDPLVLPEASWLMPGQERWASEIRRSDPEAIIARKLSETAYEHLSAAAARKEAGDAFPALVDDVAAAVPRLPAGVKATGFRGDYGMSVLLADHKRGVFLSSSPIAVPSSGTRRRGIDLQLRQAGSAFRAADPLVGVRFPKRLADGAALEASGVRLTPVTRSGAPLNGAEGVLDGASVFYADSEDARAGAADLDTLAKPAPKGLSLETVLRSQRSPQTLFFKVGLPPGASLGKAKGQSVVVQADGRTIAVISASQGATDAEGDPVPTSLSVSGDTVILAVAHPAGRYRLPIVVDPTVSVPEDGCEDTLAWLPAKGKATQWTLQSCTAGGMEDEAVEPEAESFGTWAFAAPGVSHIYDFVSETSSSGTKIENELAIVNSGKVKEAHASYPASYSQTRTELCSETGCGPGTVTTTNEGNVADFQQIGVGTKGGKATSFMPYASVSLLQETPPTPVAFQRTKSTTTWGEENALYTGGWIGPKSKSAVEATAVDPGIGVDEWGWSTLQSSEWHYRRISRGGPCVVCENWGTPGNPEQVIIRKGGTEVCGQNCWLMPSALPDGEDTVYFVAYDAAGLSTVISAQVKVDSTPPHGFSLSGLPPNKEIGNGVYHLKASATDGSGSVPSSGVASLVLAVDGKQVESPEGSCSPGPCSASGEWTISGAQFGVGQHEVTVTATDKAGNVASEKYAMFVARPTTPIAAGPGSVDPQSGELHLNATDASIGAPGASLTVARSYGSLHLTAGAEGPLGPQWSLSVNSTQSLAKLPDGDMLLTSGTGLQAVYASKGKGEFTPANGDAGLTLTEKTVEGKAQYLLKDSSGDLTTFTASSAGGGTVWLPTLRETPDRTGATVTSYRIEGSIVEPVQMIAPRPAGVSSCSPELVKGCRALQFVYASKTTATGNAQSEWGEYTGRLQEITYTAWNPAKAKMATVAVAEYAYDREGRLRAEWDPRVSPALKTTYGYDGEGHVTALTLPGQQPWIFTYGSISEDQRTGRLLATTRPKPTTAAGNGLAPANSAGPAISGTVAVGSTLTVSKGEWEDAPLSYSYRWESCNAEGKECIPLSGQTNPKLVVGNGMVAHEIAATVTATNADGSTSSFAAHTAVVKAPEWYYDYFGEIGTCSTEERENEECLDEAGLAVDSHGNVWATDRQNDRLEEFSSEGKLLATYGSGGSGNGQFNDPSGVAIDPTTGNIYVADSGNNRIEWFSSSGKYEGQFGKAGTGHNEYKDPTGIAIDAGYAFVVDTGNDRVQVIQMSSHAYVSQFGSAGSAEGQLSEPHGIALVERLGGLYAYVVDSGNDRVEYWNFSGSYEGKLGAAGNGREEFSDPTGIAYDATAKRLYVGDTHNNRIAYFEPDLAGWGTLGSTGSGYFGQMLWPTWVAIQPGDENSKYGPFVSDARNMRIMHASDASLPEPGLPLAEPPSAGGNSVSTFDYHVSISNIFAPYAFTAKETETWGQSDDPTEGTAVFPADEPMGWPAKDYKHATIYYQDGKGHTVNVVSPSGGTSTTEYNETNDVVRSLSADNRVAALKEHSKSAEVAKLLDTESTYNTEGTELLSTLGPRHLVRLPSGKESQARDHTAYSYDEGAPTEGGPYGLVTKTTQGAQIEGESEQDVRTTTTSYAGQGGLGWKLRKPTSVTTDPSGLKLTHTTIYEEGTENVTETWMPASKGAESPHDARTVYYTTAANPSYPGCGEHAEWAGLACEGLPGKQPETAGLPNLPVSTMTYNMYDEPLTSTSTVGSNTRTTKIEYDEAGRMLSRETTSTVGKSLPKVSYKYSEASGAVVEQTAGSESLKSAYNSLGQLTSYTDASGNISTYEYEGEGDERLKKLNDGKGTQTYGYEAKTSALDEVADSAAGTFKASYDAEGLLTSATYPNSMKAEYTYDQVGQPTGLKYVKTAHCASTCPETWYSDSVVPSIHGQWLTQTSSLAKDAYVYDQAGRLTETQTTQTGKGCITHRYAYDEDTNRTSLTTYQPNSKGECATESPTVERHTYDEADRLTDAGVEYEPFGGTEKLPAADAGGSALTSTFYVDGQTASLEQNGETLGHYLDPEERLGEVVESGKVAATETLHYAGPGGTPTWISEASGQSTRNISGINGLAAVQHGSEAPVLQISNLHGDIVATAMDSATVTALASTIAEPSEYGVPAVEAPPKYGWLGAHMIPTELPSGISTMGVRSYVPDLGRFLQPDPRPGGSANAYAYGFGDPVNTSDLSGESALPAWFLSFASENAHQVAEEAAAREAAARAEAERKAAEAAAQAAVDAATSVALPEGEAYEEWSGEEEEWWEEESGYGGDYVSNNSLRQEEEHAEPELFEQSLGETASQQPLEDGESEANYQFVKGGDGCAATSCRYRKHHHSSPKSNGKSEKCLKSVEAGITWCYRPPGAEESPNSGEPTNPQDPGGPAPDPGWAGDPEPLPVW